MHFLQNFSYQKRAHGSAHKFILSTKPKPARWEADSKIAVFCRYNSQPQRDRRALIKVPHKKFYLRHLLVLRVLCPSQIENVIC